MRDRQCSVASAATLWHLQRGLLHSDEIQVINKRGINRSVKRHNGWLCKCYKLNEINCLVSFDNVNCWVHFGTRWAIYFLISYTKTYKSFMFYSWFALHINVKENYELGLYFYKCAFWLLEESENYVHMLMSIGSTLTIDTSG